MCLSSVDASGLFEAIVSLAKWPTTHAGNMYSEGEARQILPDPGAVLRFAGFSTTHNVSQLPCDAQQCALYIVERRRLLLLWGKSGRFFITPSFPSFWRTGAPIGSAQNNCSLLSVTIHMPSVTLQPPPLSPNRLVNARILLSVWSPSMGQVGIGATSVMDARQVEDSGNHLEGFVAPAGPQQGALASPCRTRSPAVHRDRVTSPVSALCGLSPQHQWRTGSGLICVSCGRVHMSPISGV